jgi:hypothetical protein
MMGAAVPQVAIRADPDQQGDPQPVAARIDRGGVVAAHPLHRGRRRIRLGAEVDHLIPVLVAAIHTLAWVTVDLGEFDDHRLELPDRGLRRTTESLGVDMAVDLDIVGDVHTGVGAARGGVPHPQLSRGQWKPLSIPIEIDAPLDELLIRCHAHPNRSMKHMWWTGRNKPADYAGL